MADGTSKPIEKVKTGDQVLATDPETGEQGPRTVLATIVGTGAKTLVEITVDATTEKPADDDSDREGTPGPTAVGDVILATDGHPFWVPELGQWVAAIDLTPGMWLQTSAGTWVQITAIQTWTQAATVHNLTIQDLHTYVLAGATPVLTHNSGPDCGVPVGGRNGDRLGGEDFHGSDYSLDEMVEFVNGHTGDGNPAMGRPSAAEIETTLRQAGPRQLDGQNSSRFDHNGVRVIINWDMPWKSTSYYPGR